MTEATATSTETPSNSTEPSATKLTSSEPTSAVDCKEGKVSTKKRTLDNMRSPSKEEHGPAAAAANGEETNGMACDRSKETQPTLKKARVETVAETKSLSKPNTTSIFGSGTSSGSGSTLGFGFGQNSSSDKPLFGSSVSSQPLFGSSKNGTSSIFGSSTASKGFGFGSSSATNTQTTFSFTDSTSSTTATPSESTTPQAPVFSTSPSESISNGEEGEECTYTIRAKLFRLEKDVPKSPDMTTHTPTTEATKSTGGIQYANSIGDVTQPKQDEGVGKPNWKEVGIGPLKVLSSKANGCTTHRIVQRRESTPGGPGTKLILNVVLKESVQVGKSGEKFVTLGVMEVVSPGTNKEEEGGKEQEAKESVQAIQYLLKVKTAADAEALRSALEKVVGTGASE